MMPPVKQKPSSRKGRRTFSLSRESLRYLEMIRREKRKASTSSALDELIKEKIIEAERAKVDASISAYYDSMTEEDREQNSAWGEFAESQFPTE